MKFGNTDTAGKPEANDSPDATANHNADLPVVTTSDDVNDPKESRPGGMANLVDENGVDKTDALAQRLDQGDDNKPIDGEKVQTYDVNVQTAPTAEDVGMDVEKIQEDPANGFEKVLSDVAAADSGAIGIDLDDTVMFSSHPIQKLHIGAYQFEDTILRLKPDQVADFEELIEKLPAQDRLNIRKIDTGAANEIVKQRLDASRSATRAFDSSVGRTAMQRLQGQTPVVGTQALEDMNAPSAGFVGNGGNESVIVETDPKSE